LNFINHEIINLLITYPCLSIRENNKFDFSDFHKAKPSECLANDEWLQWFIGFSEGDGNFNVRGKGKGFTFSIVQDEKYILNHIRDTLGFGKVAKFKNQEKWSFYVQKRYHIPINIDL
jgi:hypothetical protein